MIRSTFFVVFILTFVSALPKDGVLMHQYQGNNCTKGGYGEYFIFYFENKCFRRAKPYPVEFSEYTYDKEKKKISIIDNCGEGCHCKSGLYDEGECITWLDATFKYIDNLQNAKKTDKDFFSYVFYDDSEKPCDIEDSQLVLFKDHYLCHSYGGKYQSLYCDSSSREVVKELYITSDCSGKPSEREVLSGKCISAEWSPYTHQIITCNAL